MPEWGMALISIRFWMTESLRSQSQIFWCGSGGLQHIPEKHVCLNTFTASFMKQYIYIHAFSHFTCHVNVWKYSFSIVELSEIQLANSWKSLWFSADSLSGHLSIRSIKTLVWSFTWYKKWENVCKYGCPCLSLFGPTYKLSKGRLRLLGH